MIEVEYIFRQGIGWVPSGEKRVKDHDIKVGDIILGWKYSNGTYKNIVSPGSKVYTVKDGYIGLYYYEKWHAVGKPTQSGNGMLEYFVIK